MLWYFLEWSISLAKTASILRRHHWFRYEMMELVMNSTLMTHHDVDLGSALFKNFFSQSEALPRSE